jgi:aspartate-semialdehyde dehydrogenase
MSRPSAEADGRARVALVGATTVDGVALRKALVSRGVPGSRVDLYASQSGEALISEYDGEARLIQDPDPEEIVAHEVIFLCEPGALAERVARTARPESIVIDLIGGLGGTVQPQLVDMDVNPESAQDHGGFLAVPHPLAMLLGDVLHPLERELGIDDVVAVIIRPAADFGDGGVEELREQVVKLLNFGEVPVDTFGRQLAFNIIPQQGLSCETRDVESIAASQVTRMLGWSRNRLTLRLLTAPIFYGHGLLVRLRLRSAATLERVRAILEAGSFVESAGTNAPTTPMDVTGEKTIRLSELSDDGCGGFWLWVVAGEIGERNAEQAVRLAGSVSDI